jgi:2-dehydro-3-deoxygluconokinase
MTFEIMSTEPIRASSIALFGECMIELREEPDGRLSRGYGGDVLNTAVYLSRLLGNVATIRFITVMGDDAFSEDMIASWVDEGICCDSVGRKSSALPGLYLVQTDASGERQFHYWRNAAPARDLLEPEWQTIQDRIFDSSWIYLSGITLAISSEAGRERLVSGLAKAKERGVTIAFDGNYRPALWGDADIARSWHRRLWSLTDIALPSADDEKNLFLDADIVATAHRLGDYGISEIAIKQGVGPVILSDGKAHTSVPVPVVRQVVDTTAAGDSFNAGYLAARLVGRSPDEAAKKGMELASCVVQHRGAIIDKDQMVDGSLDPAAVQSRAPQ